MVDKLEVTVRQIRAETARVHSFELVAPDRGALPPFTAGAHVDVFMSQRLARSYSLLNDPEDRDRYMLGVLHETGGRGGSVHMHRDVRVGDRLTISAPINDFELAEDASDSLLIAGGIGITPMLSMCRFLHRTTQPFALHYCARDRADAAFADALETEPFSERVTFHFDGGDPGRNGIDLGGLLGGVPPAGRHLYCCGPAGLMAAVTAASAHWPPGTVHFEAFTAIPSDVATAPAGDDGDRPVTVVVASSGQEIEVPADRTILEALWDNGVDVDAVCQEGVCGTCLVDVLEGTPDHRDSILTDEEHAEGKLMTVCCSRALTDRLVLDL